MNRQTSSLPAVRQGHRSEFVQTPGGPAIPGLQRGTDSLCTSPSTVIGDGVDSRENAPSDRPTAAPARPVRHTPDACTARPARAQLMINRLNSPPAVGSRQVRTVFPQGLPRILGGNVDSKAAGAGPFPHDWSARASIKNRSKRQKPRQIRPLTVWLQLVHRLIHGVWGQEGIMQRFCPQFTAAENRRMAGPSC